VTIATTTLIAQIIAVQHRTDRQMQVQQEARLAIDAIAVALRCTSRAEQGQHRFLESVDDAPGGIPAHRVRFFTVSRRPIRAGEPESDVREVEFFLAASGDGKLPALYRRTDPTRNEEPDGGGIVEPIAHNIVALHVRYFDGSRWYDTWDEQSAWPLAVRVELTALSANDPRYPCTVSRLIYLPALRVQEPQRQTDTRS